MTQIATIRTTLARLWNTDASAYDMAWAILKAVDIESDDLEIEVESVISPALKARDLIDLEKLAEAVAKVLPGDVAEPVSLCEAICREIDDAMLERPDARLEINLSYRIASGIVQRNFAALTVEELAEVIEKSYAEQGFEPSESMSPVAHRRVTLNLARALDKRLKGVA